MGAEVDAALAECRKFKPDCQRNWFIAQSPSHTIYIDAFWLDQTEVTNAMYAKCVGAGMCEPPTKKSSNTRGSYYGNPKFDDYPVIYVNWYMAGSYCEWAGRRLPTEAEWEKAARGTDANIYPWGNGAPNKDLLNYRWTELNDTAKVGLYPKGASPYGVLNMAGNVGEWVDDWYDAYPGGDPNGDPGFGKMYRVQRGGSWSQIDAFVPSYGRAGTDPTTSFSGNGFRCARSP